MSPTVSILLPTHNPRLNWIFDAISSVLAQTYQDFELIILDDASSFGVKESVENVLNDRRIIFLRNENNLKLTETLNKGINFSKGKYIARIDDDDVWSQQDKLEKQVGYLDSHPECGIIGTSIILIDENGTEIDRLKMRKTDDSIRNTILQSNQLAHSSILLRKSALEEAGGKYNPQWNLVEDYELWLRLGLISKFSNIEEYCVKYRVRNGGVSGKKWFKQRLLSMALSWQFKNKYPHGISSFFLKFVFSLIPSTLQRRIASSKPYKLLRK